MWLCPLVKASAQTMAKVRLNKEETVSGSKDRQIQQFLRADDIQSLTLTGKRVSASPGQSFSISKDQDQVPQEH